MAAKEQSRALKQEVEDLQMQLDGARKSEGQAKGGLEQQLTRTKEQLSRERLVRAEAEEQQRTL